MVSNLFSTPCKIVQERLVEIIKSGFFCKAARGLHPAHVCVPTQVAMADVDGEERRGALFAELLEASRREAEFQHLALLLQAWPPLSPEQV